MEAKLVQLRAMEDMKKQLYLSACCIRPQDFTIAFVASKVLFKHDKDDVLLEEFDWNTLQQVEVESNVENDQFWILTDMEGSKRIPVNDEIKGHETLLEKLLALKNFDHSAFMEACDFGEDDRGFLLWQKS